MSEKKVLIVEDEPKIAQLLEEYLQTKGGYSTHKIMRGDEVRDWVRQHSPDLVLLDLMLPGMDGIEVCKQLRSESEVPIIMVTARVEEIDRLLGLELGADDYICKPFSPREVVARVRAVLRRAGPHEVVWNGRNDRGQLVASGTYFYRIESDGFVATRRMTLLK